MGDEEFDGVGGGDLAGEVVEDGFPVDEGDGGDAVGAGVLEVVGVLGVVVLDVVDKGFESVEVALLGAEGGRGGAREGVVGTEPELVVDSGDLLEVAADGEVAQGRERVHRWRGRCG